MCFLRNKQFLIYKVMGGSSSTNGMLYVRGSPSDFDGWVKLGNKGWSYKEALYYFKKSENNRDDNVSNKKNLKHLTLLLRRVQIPRKNGKNPLCKNYFIAKKNFY